MGRDKWLEKSIERELGSCTLEERLWECDRERAGWWVELDDDDVASFLNLFSLLLPGPLSSLLGGVNLFPLDDDEEKADFAREEDDSSPLDTGAAPAAWLSSVAVDNACCLVPRRAAAFEP
jgi:hypothetical protein